MSRRMRVGLISVGVLILLIGLTVRFFPRERLLLKHATKVGDIHQAESEPASLSQDSVLLNEDTDIPLAGSNQQETDDNERRGFTEQRLLVQNVRSGTITRLPHQTAWFNTLWRPFNFEIYPSPDGKYALFYQGSQYYEGTGAASLEDDWHEKINDSKSFPQHTSCWMPDSRHWVEFPYREANDGIVPVSIHTVREAPKSKPVAAVFALPPNSEPEDWEFAVTPEQVSGIHRNTENGIPISQLNTFTTVLGNEPSAVKTFTFPFPVEGRVKSSWISPDGKQIALCLFSHTVPWWPRLLHRWFSSVQAQTQYLASLWLSDLDGSNMREIGHLQVGPPVEAFLPEAPPITDVRWLGDGKRLSFIHDNALWVVPADD